MLVGVYGFPYWLPKSNLYCSVCADPDNRVRETLRLFCLTVSVSDLDTMAVITAMRTSSVAAHAAPAVRSAPVTLVAEPPLTPESFRRPVPIPYAERLPKNALFSAFQDLPRSRCPAFCRRTTVHLHYQAQNP